MARLQCKLCLDMCLSLFYFDADEIWYHEGQFCCILLCNQLLSKVSWWQEMSHWSERMNPSNISEPYRGWWPKDAMSTKLPNCHDRQKKQTLGSQQIRAPAQPQLDFDHQFHRISQATQPSESNTNLSREQTVFSPSSEDVHELRIELDAASRQILLSRYDKSLTHLGFYRASEESIKLKWAWHLIACSKNCAIRYIQGAKHLRCDATKKTSFHRLLKAKSTESIFVCERTKHKFLLETDCDIPFSWLRWIHNCWYTHDNGHKTSTFYSYYTPLIRGHLLMDGPLWTRTVYSLAKFL